MARDTPPGDLPPITDEEITRTVNRWTRGAQLRRVALITFLILAAASIPFILTAEGPLALRYVSAAVTFGSAFFCLTFLPDATWEVRHQKETRAKILHAIASRESNS